FLHEENPHMPVKGKQIEPAYTPVNYIPANPTEDGHLEGIDDALGGGGGGGGTMFGILGDLDTTHSPVGLWIDGGPTDSSGNSLTLSNPGGAWATPGVAVFAGKTFAVFDNMQAYARPSYDALLDIK